MNATVEARHLGHQEGLAPGIEEADQLDPGAWVEAHGRAGEMLARLRLHRLPTVLAGMAPLDKGVPRLANVAAGVLLARAADGILRAQPLGDTRACFNGGPPTRLAHEFESWAMVEVAGQRIRVTNAGRNAGARHAVLSSAASKRAFVLRALRG